MVSLTLNHHSIWNNIVCNFLKMILFSNIILGKQIPHYRRYENISERDFFNGEEKELFILGEIIKKDERSPINIDFSNLSVKGTCITLQSGLMEIYKNNNFNLFVEKIFKKNYVLILPFKQSGYSTLEKARNILLSLVLLYSTIGYI